MRSGASAIPSASCDVGERLRAGDEVGAAPRLVEHERVLRVLSRVSTARPCRRAWRRALDLATRRRASRRASPRERAHRPAARARGSSRGGSASVVRVLQHGSTSSGSRGRVSLSTTQPRTPRMRPPRTMNCCTAAASSSWAMPKRSASTASSSTTALFASTASIAVTWSRYRAAAS